MNGHICMHTTTVTHARSDHPKGFCDHAIINHSLRILKQQSFQMYLGDFCISFQKYSERWRLQVQHKSNAPFKYAPSVRGGEEHEEGVDSK